jgi:hypothetical protein
MLARGYSLTGPLLCVCCWCRWQAVDAEAFSSEALRPQMLMPVHAVAALPLACTARADAAAVSKGGKGGSSQGECIVY